MMTEPFVKFLTSFYLNLNSGLAGNVTCGLVQIPLLPGPRVLLMGYAESSTFPPGLGSNSFLCATLHFPPLNLDSALCLIIMCSASSGCREPLKLGLEGDRAWLLPTL